MPLSPCKLSLSRVSATSATSATSRWCQAPGLFRTPKAYPQPPLVHGCALAYFRGNLTDYAHAWTGMNHLPQAPQSSALPSCATARRPISMRQENVTGQSTWRTVGHNPSTARTRSHVPHRLAKRVGQAPGDSNAGYAAGSGVDAVVAFQSRIQEMRVMMAMINGTAIANPGPPPSP